VTSWEALCWELIGALWATNPRFAARAEKIATGLASAQGRP
jgi:hypothetical protein